MFMRISAAVLVAALSTAGAFAGQSQSVELAQSSGGSDYSGNTESSTDSGSSWPGKRRDRYYCVLKSGSYCSVDEQRVGGVCRCPNQTGSGRVVVR
ncbi:hypothetical protein M8R20_03985 [Pseudomonas sp. R2.Fl]|nr:hypothetical protein [Pseudomonas sp. R2.Fl]